MVSARSLRGFTLVELIVVMAVLGILAAAALPLAEVAVQRQREAELKRDLWQIRDAIDAYKHAVESGKIAASVGVSGYPPTLQSLVQGVPNPKADGALQYFLRRLPRDPFADEGVDAEKTWGLRSYMSGPDKPRAGDDVYDVYSLSDKVGLNGVPLRAW